MSRLPRAAQAPALDTYQAQIAPAALRHRLILNFEAEAEGVTTDLVLDKILAEVPRDAVAAKVSA